MRTNSAIPIVQQKRGALTYKYHCADLNRIRIETVIHFIFYNIE